MRLMCRVALGLAALFAVPALHAQTSFSVAAGLTVPIGSTADNLKAGYNATVGLGIKPPLAPIGLRIDGMLNSMDLKTKGTYRILAGTANVTLSGLGMPIPMTYLIGGLGMYNSSFSGLPLGQPKSTTDFGFNIGAGIKIPLTSFSTFLAA